MQKAGEILGNALRRLNRPEAALAWLTSAWPSIVGPALAAHTRPLRSANGRLELIADSKVWQQQLESMQRELCDRVNEAWGASLVREVAFVPSKLGPKLPHEADNEHIPFIRRRRG
jgi:predicted nucleic acid-binding Zn ribbon protein